MSADNRICLMEWDHSTAWYGWHGSCSMNYYEPPVSAKRFRTKEEALDWALEEERTITLLEGGVTIIDIEEQKIALEDTIEDAAYRLKNLNDWSMQYPINNDLNFK